MTTPGFQSFTGFSLSILTESRVLTSASQRNFNILHQPSSPQQKTIFNYCGIFFSNGLSSTIITITAHPPKMCVAKDKAFQIGGGTVSGIPSKELRYPTWRSSENHRLKKCFGNMWSFPEGYTSATKKTFKKLLLSIEPWLFDKDRVHYNPLIQLGSFFIPYLQPKPTEGPFLSGCSLSCLNFPAFHPFVFQTDLLVIWSTHFFKAMASIPDDTIRCDL